MRLTEALDSFGIPLSEERLEEAEYQGRKVTLNKPFRTPDGPKKFSVYTKNEKGNVVKVNFGDPNMEIKRDDPKRRKNFRARHNCDDPGPKHKARYWSCQATWNDRKKVSDVVESYEPEFLIEAVQADDAIVMFPVSINGKHTRKDGTPMHITLRWGKWKSSGDELADAVTRALEGKAVNPPRVTHWQPDVFKSQAGDQKFHVLILDRDARIKELRDALEPVFGQDKFKDYKMHITVDEDFWNQVQEKFVLPADVRLEVGALELRLGNRTLKTFR